MGVTRDWVVRKGGYFYRPGSAGYTSSIHEAGRYTEADAKAEADHAAGVTAHLASEFKDVPCTTSDEMRKALQLARNRIEFYGLISPSRHSDHDAKEILPKIDAAIGTAGGGKKNAGVAVIEGDTVVIRFPLDRMQSALDGAWALNKIGTRYRITDINEFSKEFVRAMNREDEQGTTEVHRMADQAFIDCIEQGAFGIEEHEQQSI